MKKISVLGSTGSIGTQTLETVDSLGDIEVVALTAHSNIALLEKQIRKYKPKIASVMDEALASELKIKVADTKTKICGGVEGIVDAAVYKSVDMVMAAIVGIAGLPPTLAAVYAGKDIALANKETLVTAGDIFTKAVAKNKVRLMPVDSEHCAIFQCLAAGKKKEVKKIIITASGGPFRGFTRDEVLGVTKEQALKHPNWSMGQKITIDSATLMNKGLEVIEAHWLFNLGYDKIDVLVHPQSVIHSMVEFIDNSVIAQLGVPDMRLPIQYALTYPKRKAMQNNSLDFSKYQTLSFSEPDTEVFRCLALAYRVGKIGGSLPAVLNGANEKAVELFLGDKIRFSQISDLIERAIEEHKPISNPTVADIIASDKWAREYVAQF